MRYGKQTPKDHILENVRRMRRIQRQAQRKDAASEAPLLKPVNELWKSAKYEDISSKIAQDVQAEPAAPRPHTANFLRAHSRTGFIPPSCPASPRPPPEEKLTVPKAAQSADVLLVRRDTDFIKLNGRVAKQRRQAPRGPLQSDAEQLEERLQQQMHGYKRGYIPKYLVVRREQWAEAEQQRVLSMPDPDMPPGHKRMSEEERHATLDSVTRNHRRVLRELNSLPVRTDTMRLREHKQALQTRLGELEEAIQIFSQPKVFVKCD